MTSILLVGSPEGELLFHPSWLVWACGSLLITAREQIRGMMVLHAGVLHDYPGRAKTTAGCSQNSLADYKLVSANSLGSESNPRSEVSH